MYSVAWRVKKAMIASFRKMNLRVVESIQFCSGYFVALFLIGAGIRQEGC